MKYKTKNNLKKLHELIDNACGSLDNALIMISEMRGISEDVQNIADKIDFSALSSLKEEIELLMEDL